jgi:hypothetical protein
LIAEKISYTVPVIALEFDRTIFDGSSTGELGFQVRREAIEVHVFGIEAIDDRDFFAIPTFVDANRDLLGFFRHVFADAQLLG